MREEKERGGKGRAGTAGKLLRGAPWLENHSFNFPPGHFIDRIVSRRRPTHKFSWRRKTAPYPLQSPDNRRHRRARFEFCERIRLFFRFHFHPFLRFSPSPTRVGIGPPTVDCSHRTKMVVDRRIADDVKEEREFEVIWMNTMIIAVEIRWNTIFVRFVFMKNKDRV